ncbi:MAG: hypothetical protein GY849_13550, partial [Deltaproteobacteria bacterium]|nr:hypothetical protein [Deltaproteobacteria bacterium]
TQTLTSGGTGAGKDFNSLTVDGTTNTVQLATNAAGIAGTLTIALGDTLDMNGQGLSVGTLSNDGTLQLQGGEPLTIGTMDTNSGLVKYVGGGTSPYTIVDFGGTDYFNLEIAGGGAETFQLGASALTVNGMLTNTSGLFDTNAQDITAAGLTVAGGTFNNGSDAGTWDIGTGGVSISGGGTLIGTSGTMTVEGDFANAATFTHNSGTVDFDLAAAGTQQLTSNANQFSTLTHSGTGTLQLVDGVSAAGTITNSAGDFDTAGQSVTAAGLTVSGGTFNSTSSAGAWDIGTSGVSISGGGTLIGTSGTMTVEGDFANAATFTHNSGTVQFDGSGTQTLTSGGTGAGKDFNSLTVDGTTNTVQLATNAAGIAGTLTIALGD